MNPVTAADVLGWFQETMAHHRPRSRMPTVGEVVGIVSVVNLLREDIGGRNAKWTAKFRRVQATIKVLREDLPEFLKIAESRSPRSREEVNEMSLAMQYNALFIRL